jgi:protein O-mannosyl-transferase
MAKAPPDPPKHVPQTKSESGVGATLVLYALAVAVVLLTLAFFLPTLSNRFVDRDDFRLLIDNSNYRDLDAAHLRWMLTTFYSGFYEPVTWLTFTIDYFLWGLDPLGYHFTSLAVHSANALLFYFIALRLLSLVGRDRPAGAATHLAAGFAALLFAIHPLRVESVAWITERRGLVAALFSLATLGCYLRAVKENAARARWMASAVIFYVMSLLAKPAGATLPLVLLILDFYPLRRLTPGRWFAPEARVVWREKIPFVALAIVFTIVAFAAARASGALAAGHYGLAGRIATVFFAPAFYLWKMILPVDLSPIYALPLKLETTDWIFFILGAVVDVGLTIALVAGRKRWPGLLAAWSIYLVFLIPLVGFPATPPLIAADRYSYLACLVWPISAAAALLHLVTRVERNRARTAVIAAAAVFLIVVYGTLTWRQTEVWHDPLTLWHHAVTAYPRAAEAQTRFANALVQRRLSAEALTHYRLAVELDPNYKEGHHNLGLTLAENGDLAGAMREYREALRIDPDYKEARNNLAAALYYQGDLAGAAEQYRRAIAADPRFKEARNNLGVVLMNQGKAAEAIAEYRAAVAADPNYKEAHYNLANALLESGKPDEAVVEYQAALAIDPNYQEASANLAVALRTQKKKE